MSRKSRWGDKVSDEEAARALTAAVLEDDDKRKRKERQDADRPRKKRPPPKTAIPPEQNYYGPGDDDDEEQQEKEKPNFGLSGALAKDQSGGTGSNVYKGILLRFQEPPEARTPSVQWRFYVFKGKDQIDTLHVAKQSAYLWGRNQEIADVVLQHPSCSSQHAVLQYRALPNSKTGKLSCQPYLMDLESTNGSFINGVRIDSARYYQLKKGDVLRFGASTREYVLLTADTKSLK